MVNENAGQRFSETVRIKRKHLGIKQLELARRAGVNNTALSRWEKGKGVLSQDQIDRISEVIESAWGELANSGELESKKLDREAAARGIQAARIRERLGITQKDLSQRAGISQTLISLFENGYEELTEEQFQSVGKVLAELADRKGLELEQPMGEYGGKKYVIRTGGLADMLTLGKADPFLAKIEKKLDVYAEPSFKAQIFKERAEELRKDFKEMANQAFALLQVVRAQDKIIALYKEGISEYAEELKGLQRQVTELRAAAKLESAEGK